jgi:hypothetical protein
MCGLLISYQRINHLLNRVNILYIMSREVSSSSETKCGFVENIPTLVKKIQCSFLEQKTKGIAFRLEQLRKLWWWYVLYCPTRSSRPSHPDLRPRAYTTQAKIIFTVFRITRRHLSRHVAKISAKVLLRLSLGRSDGARMTLLSLVPILQSGWKMKKFLVLRRSSPSSLESGKSQSEQS